LFPQPNDASHITESDKVTREFIASESGDGFTRVIVKGIDPSHVTFMKNSFEVWTRQLA